MATMENAEEVFHLLDDFSKRKPKIIPPELNDYLAYVARTGDPVFQWNIVKSLFKEKLINVITDFYETSPGIDIPPYPNCDAFNYDIMKNSLLERLDSFNSAPFTVQRICELLTFPRKQYNRVDKYMRAIEKNILVVSTREPGHQHHPETENGEQMEPVVNGSDNNSEYNVDVEMEDISWKENNTSRQNPEPQPGSSDAHISVDDLEARLQAKQETPTEPQEKTIAQYEAVTPPEINISETSNEPIDNTKEVIADSAVSDDTENKSSEEPNSETKVDAEMKCNTIQTMVIPEIKIDDAEMTEQKLLEQAKEDNNIDKSSQENIPDQKLEESSPTHTIDESSSDSNNKEEVEPKQVIDMSSSEESSSSSDNTDGNSNSPKVDEQVEIQETCVEKKLDTIPEGESIITEPENTPVNSENPKSPKIQSENYSISDVKSELPPVEESKPEETEQSSIKEDDVKEDTNPEASTES